jgi:hypothetical protein
VTRFRRLRGDGGTEFSASDADEQAPSRSIRITGRMTTVARPACGGGFSGAARRACDNTTTVPNGLSPAGLRIENSEFRQPKRFASFMVNGALKIECSKDIVATCGSSSLVAACRAPQ